MSSLNACVAISLGNIVWISNNPEGVNNRLKFGLAEWGYWNFGNGTIFLLPELGVLLYFMLQSQRFVLLFQNNLHNDQKFSYLGLPGRECKDLSEWKDFV